MNYHWDVILSRKNLSLDLKLNSVEYSVAFRAELRIIHPYWKLKAFKLGKIFNER